MSDVIPLHGERHRQTQALLPWYLNGTLDRDERALVDAHLAECDECGADLRAERPLAEALAGITCEADQGWASLRERIADSPPTNRAQPPLLRRKIHLGWALTAQSAAVALILTLVWPERQAPADPAYRALGGAPASVSGNVIVLFEPDAQGSEISAALTRAGARIVDGPTASGAFVLHVGDATRPAALARLRGDERVILAEPIGPKAQP